jgi:hypothetical protein
MIFVHDKIYAKVWKITNKSEKYTDLQVTTSEKNAEGEYVNSGWFPRLIGHAHNSLKDTLKEGDRIVITKSKLTNERYTDANGNTKSSFRFVILEAEIDSKDNAPATTPAPAQPSTSENKSAEEKTPSCPW